MRRSGVRAPLAREHFYLFYGALWRIIIIIIIIIICISLIQLQLLKGFAPLVLHFIRHVRLSGIDENYRRWSDVILLYFFDSFSLTFPVFFFFFSFKVGSQIEFVG